MRCSGPATLPGRAAGTFALCTSVALAGLTLADEGRLPAAPPACEDRDEGCRPWAEAGECEANPGYMTERCCASCARAAAACRDNRQECDSWAQRRECRKNPAFMLRECRRACKVCHFEHRAECHRKPSERPAVRAGGIDATFRAILEGQPQYRPRALSRDPWVLLLDAFLQPQEADALLLHGRDFQRSLAGGLVAEVRTSSQTWCDGEPCLSAPPVRDVWYRIANLTRVPLQNAEHLQLLRYEPGQAYGRHHDQNAPRHSAWGPRLYTFFLYLSDVEEGGETHFPELNLTITPKKGRAIIWPSVLSDDPFMKDERTDHEAFAVRKGVKYAANFWLHMYDFRGPHSRGCGQVGYVQDSVLDELWPEVPGAEL